MPLTHWAGAIKWRKYLEQGSLTGKRRTKEMWQLILPRWLSGRQESQQANEAGLKIMKSFRFSLSAWISSQSTVWDIVGKRRRWLHLYWTLAAKRHYKLLERIHQKGVNPSRQEVRTARRCEQRTRGQKHLTGCAPNISARREMVGMTERDELTAPWVIAAGETSPGGVSRSQVGLTSPAVWSVNCHILRVLLESRCNLYSTTVWPIICKIKAPFFPFIIWVNSTWLKILLFSA